MWWCGFLWLPLLGLCSWATWQRAKYIALLHKGIVAPTAPLAPVILWISLYLSHRITHIISIKVDEKGLTWDSNAPKLVTDTHESSSYQVFHSFYEEIKSKFSIKNLFLSLAESITQTLNITSCYVCEGDQHERPLALRSKGAGPTGSFSQNTGKASDS
jgi:hypothetical protein